MLRTAPAPDDGPLARAAGDEVVRRGLDGGYVTTSLLLIGEGDSERLPPRKRRRALGKPPLEGPAVVPHVEITA